MSIMQCPHCEDNVIDSDNVQYCDDCIEEYCCEHCGNMPEDGGCFYCTYHIKN